ncbi:tetratricopeptide repeat protein [Ramlibacter sp. GTP1]|uniref:Tetratricopeptide repeat protein n=1 Tax=Ramlibacter albus TaxID=2079448 RepID=A0A923M887_9BURK|nr:tetratricopeptide repeat protein [Ramlibacter albus]
MALLAAAAFANVHAAPFTPKGDDEVVEKLPANTDPAVRGVESLRRQLAARPNDNVLRLDIARRYFDLAMAQGDPRYVGYAMSALAPMEKSPPADARYWFVRGLLLQYSHDFDGALKSLQRASEIDPKDPDPIAWRAAVRMVQARYADALQECEKLAPVGQRLVAMGCESYVQASTGQLRQAYEGLRAGFMTDPAVDPGIALWLHTRLAEMAVRLQRWNDAEQHFRAALRQGRIDQFALAAYADFLLMRGRPREVLTLLEGWERSDVLLLRLALAGKAANDPRAADWAKQLRERFEAAAKRGDRLHEQEAARFELDIENKPAEALALAKRNYETQKEPRDAEILMRAAVAAKQPAAAKPALDWLKDSGYEDEHLQQLAKALQ